MLDEWYLLKMPNSERLQSFKICYFSAHRTVSYLQSNSFIFIRGNLTFTTQQAKGVRKSDPEKMRGFTGVEFSPGERHTQTVRK